MTDWHDLVVAATVGTASRAVDLTATPAAVATAAPPADDPAGSLLDAAVAFTVAGRAGRRLPRREIPPAAPDDPRPEVSALAGELLRPVLVDRELALAAEVLGEVAAAGRRLPDVLVPTALGLASRHREFRADVLAVCGPLAAWLGRQNLAWGWAVAGGAPVAAFDPAAWETGDRAERRAQLLALRRDDPSAAAELLRASWPTTAPDERAGLLTVLADGLGPADEPLLEATLDDRRAEVRTLAAQLLARLPGSAYRARAAERVRGLLRPERRGLRRVLVVVPPPPFDAAARRDGRQEAPGAPGALGPGATTGAGPVAARTRQLVAAAPLDVWPATTGLAPAALVGAALDGFGDEVIAGWADAALRERDPVWVTALVEAVPHRPVLQPRRAELVAALPAAQRTRAVVAVLGAAGPAEAAAVLGAVPRPWGEELVTAFARWWRRASRASPGRDLLAVLPVAGRGLPATAEAVAMLRDAADRAPEGAIWVRAARAAAETIDLRRRLHADLR